jgi:phosphatidylinositol glycan class T
LPREVVCTENLTPFLKLLPCKGKAGISTLLDGHKLFDASWQSMAIDVRPVCPAGGECVLEIEQTIDMVFDIQRAKRPKGMSYSSNPRSLAATVILTFLPRQSYPPAPTRP